MDKPTNRYFYEVSDHLGNVRAVIGVPSVEMYSANFEDGLTGSGQGEFENYSSSSFDLMDHTDAGTTYTRSQLLTGGNNSQIGVARSFKVSPGDKLKIEAFAKYWNVSSTNSNINGFATALTEAFGLSPGGSGEGALAYNALNSFGLMIAGGSYKVDSTNVPRAYINIVVFDQNYNLVLSNSTYKKIGTAAEQVGSTKTPHQYLSREMTITQPGIAYVYVSNENPTQFDVYFDDVKFTHTQSPIVAGSDYYPFGLVMDGRTITDEAYRYGYQGQYSEQNDSTGWNEFQLRMYDARFGRWLSVDPYGQYASPYLAMGNAPQMGVDPDGGFNLGATLVGAGLGFTAGAVIGLVADLVNDGKINDGYWLKGGLIGAAAGGLGGALSGDINIDGKVGFFRKTGAEMDVAINGKKRFIECGRCGRAGGLSKYQYAPGIREITRFTDVRWFFDVPYVQIARGVASGLDPGSKHTVEGVSKGAIRIIVRDQNNRNIGEYNSRGDSRTGFADPQTFSQPLPKGSTGVKISLGHPVGELEDFENGGTKIGETNGLGYLWFRTNAGLSPHTSKYFSENFISIRVRSVHYTYKRGRLLR